MEDQLGQLNLQSGRAVAVGTHGYLLLDRLHHRRVAVAQDGGPVARGIADVLVAVDAPLAGALEAVYVKGKGREHPSIVGHAVGKHALGLLEEGLGLGVGLDVLAFCDLGLHHHLLGLLGRGFVGTWPIIAQRRGPRENKNGQGIRSKSRVCSRKRTSLPIDFWIPPWLPPASPMASDMVTSLALGGAREGIRTHDLRFTKPLLYH